MRKKADRKLANLGGLLGNSRNNGGRRVVSLRDFLPIFFWTFYLVIIYEKYLKLLAVNVIMPCRKSVFCDLLCFL